MPETPHLRDILNKTNLELSTQNMHLAWQNRTLERIAAALEAIVQATQRVQVYDDASD